MGEWTRPVIASADSDGSGPEKSGSGSLAQPQDVKDSLLQMVVVIHCVAVIAALVALGMTFGWLAVTLGFVAVTIGWIIWIRKYMEDEAQKKRDELMADSRRAASRFSDPRASTE